MRQAQRLVIEDPEILRGTPVIRGTRIPVYDVASLVDAGTPLEELREIYPKLTPSQIELVSMYAKANPQRERPRLGICPRACRSQFPRSDFVAPY